jgi:hypothetical protein
VVVVAAAAAAAVEVTSALKAGAVVDVSHVPSSGAEYTQHCETTVVYISDGMSGGHGSLYPLLTLSRISKLGQAPYGRAPAVNTSMAVTPNDHT